MGEFSAEGFSIEVGLLVVDSALPPNVLFLIS
jgi:hypothetical protein